MHKYINYSNIFSDILPSLHIDDDDDDVHFRIETDALHMKQFCMLSENLQRSEKSIIFLTFRLEEWWNVPQSEGLSFQFASTFQRVHQSRLRCTLYFSWFLFFVGSFTTWQETSVHLGPFAHGQKVELQWQMSSNEF